MNSVGDHGPNGWSTANGLFRCRGSVDVVHLCPSDTSIRQRCSVGESMTKLIAACLGACIAVLPILSSFAQDSTSPAPPVDPAQGQEKIASGTLTFWCTISGGGHQWNVLATNMTGRSYKCTINCAFRTSTGLVTNTSCAPIVQNGLDRARVCGGGGGVRTGSSRDYPDWASVAKTESWANSSLAWTGLTNSGNYNCR
jgi:hypothetical protein